MTEHRRWYFAYGSNMDEKRLRRRLGLTNDEPLTSAAVRLDGYRLRFNKRLGDSEWAAANIEPDHKHHVCGICWLLTDRELKWLDDYEGVNNGHYRRVVIPVLTVLPPTTDVFAEIENAVTYLCDNPKRLRDGIGPSPEYMEYLERGFPRLPVEYVANVKRIATVSSDKGCSVQ